MRAPEAKRWACGWFIESKSEESNFKEFFLFMMTLWLKIVVILLLVVWPDVKFKWKQFKYGWTNETLSSVFY